MRKKTRFFTFAPTVGLMVLLTACFMGCATNAPIAPSASQAVPPLSLADVQTTLGLTNMGDEPGFQEVVFDACYLGSALSQLPDPPADCHHVYFTLIQFKLNCGRETNEVQNSDDLLPVRDQLLKYELGNLRGKIKTDVNGRGVIRNLSNASTRRRYLRISTGTDFLVIRAEAATSIVTPGSWCR